MSSIPRIRRELIARFESLVRTRALALGIGVMDFRDWVDGIVGEGIAIAIAQNKKWDPGKGDFLYWCFLKTRSLIRKELNNERRYRKAIERMQEAGHFSSVESQFDNELREELAQILGQLTLAQQKALALYYLSGMTVDSLAEILDKNPKAVYGLLRRARRKASVIVRASQVQSNAALNGSPVSPLPPELSPEDLAKKRSAQQKAIDRLYDLNEGERNE